jgi:RNA-directed DNA polymerase
VQGDGFVKPTAPATVADSVANSVAASATTSATVPKTSGTPQASGPPEARQAEDVRSRWEWAEATVWTKRMLTALETGVKGGKWFRLIDKVYAPANLAAGFTRVQANDGAAGVDHMSVDDYAARADANLASLAESLRLETYRPQPIRRTYIPKPDGTQRPLGIPTVRDRVVQTAVRHVIEPIFERTFAEHSYGFRPGRSCRDALRRVDQLLKDGCVHVVDADLKSCFDTIPHDRLMERVRSKIADGRVLRLLESFLKQGVLDGLAEWTPEEGTPQGAVVSPLLANVYLDPLDHLLAEQGLAMVRYADDFVILCRTPEEAQRALALVRQWTSDNGLTLHPTKTRTADVRQEGFDFLGYRFAPTSQGRIRRWPRTKSLAKLKDNLRNRTRRANGKSFRCIIADVNAVLRGWFGYFKHSIATVFGTVDGWVRMRLRSILRKRRHRSGRGRGRDHQLWPNAFFADQGLYSLMEAHRLARQPSLR